jgi:hypothetical protein
VSKVCKEQKCALPSPTDGKQNADETDVDCGGGIDAARCADGKKCVENTDCQSQVCTNLVCAIPSATDAVKNGDETDVDCGGKKAPACEPPKACAVAEDCTTNVCKANACVTATADDGVKNGTETDVDCGGADAGTPRCATSKKCVAGSDCQSKVCNGGTKTCSAPTPTDGLQNGTETDVDCGGAGNPKCAVGKTCVAGSDCTTLGCDDQKKCAVERSCTQRYGGRTCGTGEVGDVNANHESCCKSIEVPGYSDPQFPGKRVYVDKYEITAGRIRAFVEGLQAQYGGKPDIKTYIAQNKPLNWNDGWNFMLASDTDEAANVTMPHPQNSPPSTNPANVGTNYAFGSSLYQYIHGHNCYQGGGAGPANSNAYGYNTFWYSPAVMTGQNGGWPRAFSKDELDTRAMNCIPAAVLAAFCAWDGGQLATSAALKQISGATLSSSGLVSVAGRLPARTGASSTDSNVNWSSDGSQNPYYYRTIIDPAVPGVFFNQQQNTHEGAGRIAPPGRMAGDRTASAPASTDSWADLRGNLNEVVLVPAQIGAASGFALEYEGVALSSARAGGNTTAKNGYPEHKAGFAGGRCMRFK